MKKYTVLIMIISLVLFKNILSNENSNITLPALPILPGIQNSDNVDKDYEVPEIKKSGTDIDGDDLRHLEKTYTVMMEAKVDVFIPLEVISDINIETTIVGNQIQEIPFDIELNRRPEKKDYYSVKYSESILDIDNDGQPDTYIHSPKYINEKISKDNYVKIYGEKISKEGKHAKTVYVTVEAGEE